MSERTTRRAWLLILVAILVLGLATPVLAKGPGGSSSLGSAAQQGGTAGQNGSAGDAGKNGNSGEAGQNGNSGEAGQNSNADSAGQNGNSDANGIKGNNGAKGATPEAAAQGKGVVAQIEGAVSEVGEGYVVVGGQRLQVTAETLVQGELAPGAMVRVRVRAQAAERIQVKAQAQQREQQADGQPGQDEAAQQKPAQETAFTGAIERCPPNGNGRWMIDGQAVQVTDETTLSGTPQVGARAQVVATRQGNGVWHAVSIVIQGGAAPAVITVAAPAAVSPPVGPQPLGDEAAAIPAPAETPEARATLATWFARTRDRLADAWRSIWP